MAVGIELPKHYMKKEWLTMFMLLIPTMLFMWLVSGLFIWWLIPPINYLHSLVIAACVCPTDPILANSVVKGRFAEKHVPAHIRNALSAESGANDGMGFPFLFLALFLLSEPKVGTAIGKWIYITLLFQIILSCIIGLVVGYIARKILQWSERNRLIDKPSFLCFAIALALFLMSMTGFSGSDDLLACFVAGNAFSWDDWFRQETEEAHFQDVIDTLLNLAVFVYIGAIIPWSEFGNTEIGLKPWRLVVIAILILFFRRLPILLILKPVMPAMKTYREAVFSGWFGPMGVGAVFLSVIAKERMEEIYEDSQEKPLSIELIAPVVLFIVLSSTLVHGTTIPLFKLGNRIRTRTLSITSTGSNGVQISRLPKIQFGQQIGSVRKKENGNGERVQTEERAEAMAQLRRNTLANTIQPQSQSYTIDIGDDHEEDFLPDEEAEETRQQPSSATTESQSIRFLEPVNPRNAERNETSVSSFKSWIHRNSIKEATNTSSNDESADKENMTASQQPHLNHHPSNSGGATGLRNLFRRHQHTTKDDEQESPLPPTVKVTSHETEGEESNQLPPKPAYHQEGKSHTLEVLKSIFAHHPSQHEEIVNMATNLSSRIEVWDELDHIEIEDKEDSSSNIVVSKKDPGWEKRVKTVIEELQDKIDKQQQQQQHHHHHHYHH
ncbi:Sodium/hydrogen exchanger family-domain-containing protein [Cokeromyces recurvatus]|uniref:Sodium/hydrogen exchanger family-domain-containing protein n=1 Tax=Cokeromyces recurvatus TaxID=90255 RepID=UPI00221F4EF1|nr:Sodium/hydrogen exchanger family-domain-containing protein [Cokeromyces recurvatus]KAI7908210.1 Sodium/hydrogen exchanger family-domain-containing protein [Cokeromyces recurvatus]